MKSNKLKVKILLREEVSTADFIVDQNRSRDEGVITVVTAVT